MIELHFTQENIEWLSTLVDEAISRTDNEIKLLKLNGINEKLHKLNSVEVEVGITSEDIKAMKASVGRLQDITEKYVTQKGISNVNVYDELKKDMNGELAYLGTLKDLFLDELSYSEDVFKKEIRAQIVDELSELEGVSFTKADKLVEKDIRYSNMRKKVHGLKKLSNNVKTKYDFYLKTWNMIFQSVSTATKERHNDNNN